MSEKSTAESEARLDEFDYSTPEARHAMKVALDLVLEIREERDATLRGELESTKRKLEKVSRRLALYERTLGLAVVPVRVKRVLARWVRRYRGEAGPRR